MVVFYVYQGPSGGCGFLFIRHVMEKFNEDFLHLE